VKNCRGKESNAAELSADSEVTEITGGQQVIEEQCSDWLRLIILAERPACTCQGDEAEASYSGYRLATCSKTGREQQVDDKAGSCDECQSGYKLN